MSFLTMTIFRYVNVYNNGQFMNIDDGSGPITSGYPYGTSSIEQARLFESKVNAQGWLKYSPEKETCKTKKVAITYEFEDVE